MEEFAVIEDPRSREKFEKLWEFVQKHSFGMTEFQIRNFVLNDVEFPTKYVKFRQAVFELRHRLQLLLGYYYDIKEVEIKLKLKRRDMDRESDDLKRELFNVQQGKLVAKLNGLKAEVKRILSEAEVFYKVYAESGEFHDLTEAEEQALEEEGWAAKTRNMPLIFEERYGDRYMQKVLLDQYPSFVQIRRKELGLLPREILMKTLATGSLESTALVRRDN